MECIKPSWMLILHLQLLAKLIKNNLLRDCRFKVSKFSFLILKKGNVGAIMILNLNKRLSKYMNEYKALGAQFGNVFMCSII